MFYCYSKTWNKNLEYDALKALCSSSILCGPMMIQLVFIGLRWCLNPQVSELHLAAWTYHFICPGFLPAESSPFLPYPWDLDKANLTPWNVNQPCSYWQMQQERSSLPVYQELTLGTARGCLCHHGDSPLENEGSKEGNRQGNQSSSDLAWISEASGPHWTSICEISSYWCFKHACLSRFSMTLN